jgi:hypothetical protein
MNRAVRRSPTEHVIAKGRVIPYPGKRRGVQHLQQQSGDSPNHHRGDIAVDAPDHRALRIERVVRANDRRFAAPGIVEDVADRTDQQPLYCSLWSHNCGWPSQKRAIACVSLNRTRGECACFHQLWAFKQVPTAPRRFDGATFPQCGMRELRTRPGGYPQGAVERAQHQGDSKWPAAANWSPRIPAM